MLSFEVATDDIASRLHTQYIHFMQMFICCSCMRFHDHLSVLACVTVSVTPSLQH